MLVRRLMRKEGRRPRQAPVQSAGCACGEERDSDRPDGRDLHSGQRGHRDCRVPVVIGPSVGAADVLVTVPSEQSAPPMCALLFVDGASAVANSVALVGSGDLGLVKREAAGRADQRECGLGVSRSQGDVVAPLATRVDSSSSASVIAYG